MADPIEPTAPVIEPMVVPDKNGETVSKAQFDAVIAELKDLRGKKVQDGAPTVDVDKKIAEALVTRDREEADKNWAKAQAAFLAKHKEYHPDNDTGGLKKAILDRELALLNRNGLTSVEDLESILEKANVLATSTVNTPVRQVRIDPSIPRPVSQPHGTDQSKLSDKELRVLDILNQLGTSTWTEERFLALKAKDPGFVERTLAKTI